MENNFFRRIPTDIDLNGPVLAYTTQPSDDTKNRGDSVTFTVAAEATFPGNTGADNSGTITFQWYEGEGQALTNSGNVSGATSASLTISDLDTPADDGRNFYCEISYTAGDEYDSTDKGTGTAINQPLKSSVATLSMNPLLEIVSQPSSATVYTNVAATHTIGAKLTDNSSAVTYQWYVGVENATPTLVENKTYRTQNIERETVTVIDENFVTDTTTHSDSRSFNRDGQSAVNIPPTGYNASFIIAGAGGGSGGSDAGGEGGRGGSGRYGSFSIPNSLARGQSFTFRIGSQGGGGGRGNFPAYGRPGAGLRVGGRGGGAGPRGWSGGGGGGGGSSGVFRGGTLIASAGGGGGGGGGSHDSGRAPSGSTANSWYPYNGGTITTYNGGQGADQGNDGGGGGGGGAGSGGPAGGGGAGRDRTRTGSGGGGGNSDYRSDIVSLSVNSINNGNGYGSINYQYTTSTTRPVKTPREVINEIITYQNTVISGQGTPTLSIKSDNAEFNTSRTLYCVVSNSTASNSPLTSDTVTSAVTDPREQDRIIIETIAANGIANIQEANLLNGEEEFKSGSSSRITGDGGYLYSIYAPDKDIAIEMDLFGGKGRDYRNGKVGGEGGYSRIRFTLKRNNEYVIAGLTNSINTPFIYRGSNLLAVVGGGGDAGLNGNGGRGGGIGLSGEQGRNIGGLPGDRVAEGTLGANGIWSRLIDPPTGVYAGDSQVDITSTSGGRTIKCTKGDYWATQGKTACEPVNALDQSLKFRMADGSEVSNTAALGFRGYKDGYAIQHTGGLGRANSRTDSAVGPPDYANGGNGATGGSGGRAYSSAGGGSGYSNGSVTVVDTQLGGSNSSQARVLIRRVV